MPNDTSGGVFDLPRIESGPGCGDNTAASPVEQHPAKAPPVALAVVLFALRTRRTVSGGDTHHRG